MLNIRQAVLTGLAVAAIGAVWHAKTIAQENSSSGVVTVFDHEKLNASFAKGDVYIVPPDTIHWYKNVETPFRYVEVPVP